MEEMKLVAKQYYVIVRPFQDAEDRPQRELDIIPEIVYDPPGAYETSGTCMSPGTRIPTSKI